MTPYTVSSYLPLQLLDLCVSLPRTRHSSTKPEHAIHARAHASGNMYMASEHEQAHLQTILDEAYLEWSTHARNELVSITQTDPRARGRRGGLPPEFQDVHLRKVLATKAYT
eukprot:4153826-Pyramimonas_sp.AAC.1